MSILKEETPLVNTSKEEDEIIKNQTDNINKPVEEKVEIPTRGEKPPDYNLDFTLINELSGKKTNSIKKKEVQAKTNEINSSNNNSIKTANILNVNFKGGYLNL